jgi:hypothetical protein
LEEFKIFLKTCCQKNPSKNLNEKILMFKKGPFMVEFFFIVGSFDYDCTHKVWPFFWLDFTWKQFIFLFIWERVFCYSSWELLMCIQVRVMIINPIKEENKNFYCDALESHWLLAKVMSNKFITCCGKICPIIHMN